MAKFKGGVLSGLIGSVVVVKSKTGDSIIRSAPGKRSKKSFTDNQKQNWARFSQVSAFWKKFAHTPVQEIWKVAEEGRRGINLFINANAPAFGQDGLIADPERLHFSAGKLPLPHKLEAVRQPGDPTKIEVSWEDQSNGLSRADDELMMMMAHNGEFTGPVYTGVLRKTKHAVLQLPSANVQGIYLFFGSIKRKIYSGDIYFEI